MTPRERNQKFLNIKRAEKVIKKDLRMIGLITCPACEKELHYSLSLGHGKTYNISAKCETKNCLHWEGYLHV